MGNSLYLRFVSDGSRGRKGFYIQWYTTTKGIAKHNKIEINLTNQTYTRTM